jgi:aspartokinase
VAARVLSAVAEEKINVEIISFGTSEVAYYFIVLENDLEKAIKAINREFFEKVQ